MSLEANVSADVEIQKIANWDMKTHSEMELRVDQNAVKTGRRKM